MISGCLSIDNTRFLLSCLELQKQTYSRLGILSWNSIDPSIRLSHKRSFKFKISKSLLNTLKIENDHIDLPIIELLPRITAMKFLSTFYLLFIDNLGNCLKYI